MAFSDSEGVGSKSPGIIYTIAIVSRMKTELRTKFYRWTPSQLPTPQSPRYLSLPIWDVNCTSLLRTTLKACRVKGMTQGSVKRGYFHHIASFISQNRVLEEKTSSLLALSTQRLIACIYCRATQLFSHGYRTSVERIA